MADSPVLRIWAAGRRFATSFARELTTKAPRTPSFYLCVFVSWWFDTGLPYGNYEPSF
jgi:hypothetical protein